MKYKISIIIPVFNVEHYIKNALESIVKQTIGFENLEVIMIDDCSTDKSGEIIDEYAGKYNNFIAVHLPENSGPEKPRNVGIEKATGEYLMFLDPDDFYAYDMCETLYHKIVEEKVDVVSCNFNFFIDGVLKKNKRIFGNLDEIKVKTIEDNPNLLVMHPSIWAKIYKREFIIDKNIRFKEDIRAGDRVFVLKTFMEAKGIIYLQNYFGTNYRIADLAERKSFSNSTSKEVLLGRIKGYIETYDILKDYKKEDFFPLTFHNIREYWTERLVKSDTNALEKKDLLKKITFLFKEFEKYEIPVNPRKKYLIPLFNHIIREEYDKAISFSDALKNSLVKPKNDKDNLSQGSNASGSTSKRIIFSFSMVKNEMDIIESFVRYNLNILDGMIILDNGSTDNTLKILNSLKKENLSIFILEDKDKEFDKIAKMNSLLKKAVEEFNADIIIPLDADEFIISVDGKNPRKYLEKVAYGSYNYILWKTYIPFLDEKENESFIPAKITFSRDESIERSWVKANSKVVLHKSLVEKYGAKVNRGSHDLILDSKYKNKINRFQNRFLRIAHFPLRSIEQATSKISVGWLNALSSIERGKNDSHHWRKMFNQLKENGKIKTEDAIKFASEYGIEIATLEDMNNNNIEIKINEDPMDLSFCENIEIKYNNDINHMANLLDSCENLSLNYLNLKKDHIKLNKEKQNILKREKVVKEKQDRLLKEKVAKEKQNRFEIEYLNNYNRSLPQRLVSKFPSLYILFNINETGIKNALVNIKGYNSIKNNKLFDMGFYLKNNKKVRLSGMDPILHYMYHGFKEGKKPNPEFDGEYYLKKYKNVKKSNLNPLVHYSLYGINEGRIISKDQKKVGNKSRFEKKREKLNKVHPKKSRKISIKIPAPNWETAHNWGDYHFAIALKKEFEKNNCEVAIQMAPDWDKQDDAEVVLVLRGLVEYDPKPDQFNIMWNISHPDMVSIKEYNKYDHVFVASEKWANELKNKLNVSVESLIQCTDPKLFYPEQSDEYKHELLFVGNSRKNVFRKILKDLLPTERDLGVYGNRWKGQIDDEYICGEHIPNNELHKAYSSSKILLNDHWDDMREKGFISNRLFDGFAAGAFIISDDINGAKKIFGDSLVTYSNSSELHKLIDYYLDNDEERKKIIENGKNAVLTYHTFKQRAEHILEVIHNNSSLKKK